MVQTNTTTNSNKGMLGRDDIQNNIIFRAGIVQI